MPESCWGPVCELIHVLSQWIKLHLLPFAPLFTPIVATVAGAIALYSIHVTRSMARKRAAVDFFLKTDMDKGMVDAHKAFQKSLIAWEKYEKDGGPIEKFVKTKEEGYTTEYLEIAAYLNVHELIAVGIKNRMFDHDVCYNFWSDALVSHSRKTRKLIEYEVLVEGQDSAFLELRELSVKWEKKIAKWQERQRKKAAKAKRVRPESARAAPVVGLNPPQSSSDSMPSSK